MPSSIAAPIRAGPRASPLTKTTEIKVHASAAIPVALDAAGSPVREMQLLPMGRIEARDGRGPWLLKDAAHAEAVIAASRAYAGPTDILVDFDHQSIYGAKPGVGGRAPASGWISPGSLEVREDGIWATVEWTGDAQDDLKARRYRYVSPYFGADKTTGLVTRLFNVTLTNTPAIVELAAAASAGLDPDSETPASLNPGNTAPMKTVLTALGLNADATEAEACASVTALLANAKAAEQLTAAGAALGLKPEATGEEVVAAAATAAGAKPDPSKFVPVEALTEVTDKLKVINEERATAAVDDAVAAGKLTPALRSWGLELFNKDEAQFAAFVQGQPAVMTPGSGKTAAKVEGGKVQLTDEDRQACAALGISEDDFIKTRESENGQ